MARLKAMGARVGAMPARVAATPKTAERFYTSPEWRAAREAKRREGRVWCARCGATGRLILDHVEERKDGGADLDPANLEWLCRAHHQEKTARARAERAKGRR